MRRFDKQSTHSRNVHLEVVISDFRLCTKMISRAPGRWKSTKFSKIYFIAENESGRIQLQSAKKKNQNRLIRTGYTACQRCRRHYVIGLPPVTISLYNNLICILTLGVHLQDAQEISDSHLPYRHRERRFFVIYSSFRQLYYYRSPVKSHFYLWKFSQVAILKL